MNNKPEITATSVVSETLAQINQTLTYNKDIVVTMTSLLNDLKSFDKEEVIRILRTAATYFGVLEYMGQ